MIANADPVVVTRNLSKHFRGCQALSDVSIDLQAKEIVGLLGPNGSGKSTLVRVLLGFLRPTQGSARICGMDCLRDRVAVHKLVSYLPGDARLFRTMRGKDVLEFFAGLRGREFRQQSQAIAARLDLDLSRWVAFMSTGMRQKLALSVVLSSGAPILVLDEPTSNLDPAVRSEVLSIVRERQSAGCTVLLSSHLLGEIEQIADRALIMKSGRLVHEQRMGDLKQRTIVSAESRVAVDGPPAGISANVAQFSVSPTGTVFRLDLVVTSNLSPVLQWLSALPVVDVRIQPEDLMTVYGKFHSAP